EAQGEIAHRGVPGIGQLDAVAEGFTIGGGGPGGDEGEGDGHWGNSIVEFDRNTALVAGAAPPPSIPPLDGEGSRVGWGHERGAGGNHRSIPQWLGVVAVAVDDELVLDAAHGGDGGRPEAG